MLTHLDYDQAWEMLREAVADCRHCFGINNLQTEGQFGVVEVVDENSEILAKGDGPRATVADMLERNLVSTRVLRMFHLLH